MEHQGMPEPQTLGTYCLQPAKVEPHLLLGVSMAFLRQFATEANATRDTLTVELVQSIRERTAATGTSVAENLVAAAAVSADGRPLGGQATLFVSHAQACSFLKMLDALDHFVRQEGLDLAATFFWIDAFCIRQSDVAHDVAQIGSIEHWIGKVVMVLDPWDKPRCLTRVWCLYEVVHCCIVKADTFLKFTMAPEECDAFTRAARANPSAVEQLIQFDARQAEATVEQDRAMIMRLIEDQFDLRNAPELKIDESGDHIDRFNRSLRRTLSATLTDAVSALCSVQVCDCQRDMPTMCKAARYGLDGPPDTSLDNAPFTAGVAPPSDDGPR